MPGSPKLLRPARGFTLLELLVVVVIIGIIATMFTLGIGSAGGTDRELKREAGRLATLLRLALEDATFQTRDLGIRFYPDRYEFAERIPPPLPGGPAAPLPGAPGDGTPKADAGDSAGTADEPRQEPDPVTGLPRDEWRTLNADNLLTGRSLPPAFLFELDIEGRAVNLEKSAEQVAKRYEPQLFILSSGDLSDGFTVRLRDRESGVAWRVDVRIDGSSEVERDED